MNFPSGNKKVFPKKDFFYIQKIYTKRIYNYALKLARPLARRRAITARPFLVAIRARKPWLRLRFNTLG